MNSTVQKFIECNERLLDAAALRANLARPYLYAAKTTAGSLLSSRYFLSVQVLFYNTLPFLI